MLKKWEQWKSMPYPDKVRWRMKLTSLMIPAGLLLLCLSVSSLHNVSSLYGGMGGGLFGCGIVKLWQKRRLLRDPERLHQLEVMEQDERNIYIAQKSWAYSSYLLFTVLYIGMLVAPFFNETIALTLAAVMLVHVALMLIVYQYLHKVY